MVEPGRLLSGRYELLARIGRGGMGEVFHAQDRLLERAVAVKVLSPALSADAPLLGRFEREARVAASLIHPNIVTVFDTGQDGGLHFIVMELVEGPSLADLIREDAPLPSARVVEILRPLCAALAAAHAQGLVHRDVKPANILFTRTGTPKLTDFGIARAATAVTQTTSVYGTALYMAPEQARGDPSDPRVDVYALGCVAYEMLTRRPPFEAETSLGVVYHHLHTSPEPPSRGFREVWPGLEAVVLRMLAKDPSYRYADVREVGEDLELVARGERPRSAVVHPQEHTQRIDETALLAPGDVPAAPPSDAPATAILGQPGGETRLIQPGGDMATRRLEGFEPPHVTPEAREEARAKRRRARQAALVAVIALLLLGMGLAYGFVRRSTDQPVLVPPSSPSGPRAATTSPATATPTAATTTAAPRAPAPVSPPAASPTTTAESPPPTATTPLKAPTPAGPTATPSDVLPTLTPTPAGTPAT